MNAYGTLCLGILETNLLRYQINGAVYYLKWILPIQIQVVVFLKNESNFLNPGDLT